MNHFRMRYGDDRENKTENSNLDLKKEIDEEKKESNFKDAVDRRLYKCGLRLYLYGDWRRTAL